MTGVRHCFRRTVCGAGSVLLVVAAPLGAVHAAPADDALGRLNELSEQAVRSREAVTAAQRDADAAQAQQAAAEDRRRADMAALEAANNQLAPYQAAVDRLAAMIYMGGGESQMAAVLSASSPQRLIDKLALQQVVNATTADQMRGYRDTRECAAAVARASDRSAADARAAAERAATIRADLQATWQELLRQIAAAEAQYAALTPQQQAVVDNAGLPPGDLAPPPAAAIPDDPGALPVGVANEVGLQPNTVLAARTISAQFPQIATIDGVRPDSKPWHPRGLAIDIMIPNPGSPEGIALGDQIRAYALANAGRFGLQDVIWRDVYSTPAGPQATGYGHFDHVHITTTPRG
ncbi:glycoside hydrolase [Mycolicibacterium aromaticivorans JS19b1 = JCM 16368]|uniref:Glycoside hydrolase n=1 Tax=Mycolicibacterium aromaticivorans JS19b1 = JCM 16368 TaxID=1440774 RepID=A0A064CGZ6_9MYCO|nr:glycoside hydrolase [Mycolicibacterium aromaticivorans]KDE99839.1 glycoside hydrolase [Mycolicibacterium aromaticivorans JS19b1 = JCM 16368]